MSRRFEEFRDALLVGLLVVLLAAAVWRGDTGLAIFALACLAFVAYVRPPS